MQKICGGGDLCHVYTPLVHYHHFSLIRDDLFLYFYLLFGWLEVEEEDGETGREGGRL